ncbi:type 1 glutamine amidotransferase [Parasulfitobacter algicola]|uniref:Type 1 glutamine amidotransferase n=1 Tax=Parasulfitobacter algicola TaxID=2614809 RepID=A0ABX2IWF2_9RHOB|nr:type 1 glutamine amidotransferase [Sulfitobacter algicola]NSX54744.1 type 1 glutamine amidotransferase [Sulfitobacter algicola]
MKIGILQCGHTPDEIAARYGAFSVLFERMLDGHGFTFQTWNVVDMIFPDTIDQADGWLLTGSKHGAYENHAFIPLLEGFIRDTYADGRPMVGICFGHQIIAQALGGRVEKFSGGWAVGRHVYHFDGRGDMAVNALHQDQVIQVPQGAKVIASSPHCANAALVYDNRILTVQPHPELTNSVMKDYITARRGTGTFPDALMDQAMALTDVPLNSDQMATDLALFLKRERAF